MKTIFVTGVAGFIGYHLCETLLKNDYNVVGLDNINHYYNVNLKHDRLKQLGFEKADAEIFNNVIESSIHGPKMKFVRMNLEDRIELPKLFQAHKFDAVCNLAAQAGVRYSIENPEVYIDSNIVGFLNLMECCRDNKIKKLVYASSSSVYGNNKTIPFKESHDVSHPISVYAATKKSNELIAHTYSHLFGIETIGLRFFTVYGPWGRPDMALFLFTDAIINDKPIKVFNKGNLSRDFTYIDDIIKGITNVLLTEQENTAMYKLYNIGNGKPVKLLDFISAIEQKLGKIAIKEMLPMQPGDVENTWADTSQLKNSYKYSSRVAIQDGVNHFVDWYKDYFKD